MEFEELMHQDMLREAFLGLENGHLMPWDKILLAGSPLPESITQPYTTREVSDVRESMRLTYETMAVWIEESKNESYFSKRFVQLSRMIMNGVTTIGRGLITLHARGEEPGNVPVSVQDLIGVASYQFRKSHLGVFQTMRSYPEISERLMMNQIGWNNMLMRLFKTKEKLAEPISAECGIRNAELISNLESGMDTKKLSDGNIDNSEFRIPNSAISASSALSAPGAFSAPRAFSSYDHAENKKSAPRRLTSGAANHAAGAAAVVYAETETCCKETSAMMKGSVVRDAEFCTAAVQNAEDAVSLDAVSAAEQLQTKKETKTSEAKKKNKIRDTDEKRTAEIPDQENKRTDGASEEYGIQTTGTTESEITKTEEIRENNNNTEPGSPGSESEYENSQTTEETGQSSPPVNEAKRTIDDLTAREKEVLSDIRRFPMFKDQFRKDIMDPEFIAKYPKTAAVYRSVLAFLDSS